ncbi:hypothetical protein CPHO_08785 [Corynebacterium phocae]|uniref:Uncharacterized protein n=1 Tax=Corynebacterium phocae TaxID=161895 RepID=A0A1L7D4A6_9CORY|nr:hypothetical protein [Corynebacterium phocae]APT92968.1 hypothetical protein CPHO_08785 [Corynebacterium phocae]KAA8723304.1 hypothetical protein F4V58_08290 [Corynebacterium phocae]
MSDHPPTPGRKVRRRAVRPSTAVDYDRHADDPGFVTAFADDGARAVIFEDSAGDIREEPESAEKGGLDAEFYRAQFPPHYGS